MFHGRRPHCLAVWRQIAFEINTCAPYHRPISISVYHQSRQSYLPRHCISDLYVSNATGTNMCFVAIVAYFRTFLSAAASAAAPDLWTVWGRLVWAKVSATVTSQVRDLPAYQGTIVIPSGRYPSSLTSPVGSMIAGIPELHSAMHSNSLSRLYRIILPGPYLQYSPWMPCLSTIAPYGHSWGSHIFIPSRNPIAIRIDSSSIAHTIR